MNKKFLCLITFCLPLFVFSQTNGKGIKWVEDINWQQVKQQAKKENKYIFVDCYATWCKPCKQMDKEVYSLDSVGSFLNSGFVSVKLQMDSTKDDDAATKSWYKTVSYIGKEYKLTGYPTLLFFSPNGEIVSKYVGYSDPGTFLTAARDAKDPSKQYYVLLKNYEKGKKDYAHMPFLLNTAKQLNDTATYHTLLNSYYAYLHSQPKEKLYTKENIAFVASTLESSSQVLFDMFFPNGNEVNKVMQNNWYAKNVIDKIIANQIWIPFLNGSIGKSEPDWNTLYNSIVKDYGADYAGRNVLNAKIKWHSGDADPLIYATLLNDKMEKYGSDTTNLGQDFILNNKAGWDIFPRLTDTVQLLRMSRWMEGVARRGGKTTKENGLYYGYWPSYIDTYANLLYKAGRTTEAIKWQELAVAKGKERNIGKNDQEEIEENLELMKQGKPTW